MGEKPWYWGRLLINGTTYSEITADMISGFDSSAEGTTHVYVEYKGKQVGYSMEVVAPKTSDISSIVISGQPKKIFMWKEMYSIHPEPVCMQRLVVVQLIFTVDLPMTKQAH